MAHVSIAFFVILMLILALFVGIPWNVRFALTLITGVAAMGFFIAKFVAYFGDKDLDDNLLLAGIYLWFSCFFLSITLAAE